jgi:hypothetical protein
MAHDEDDLLVLIEGEVIFKRGICRAEVLVIYYITNRTRNKEEVDSSLRFDSPFFSSGCLL